LPSREPGQLSQSQEQGELDERQVLAGCLFVAGSNGTEALEVVDEAMDARSAAG